jgi:ATP-dependent DNA helicase DinG
VCNLINKNLELIFAEDGIIKSFKEDYIPRPSQIEGSDILYQALAESNNAILEGPCGFGKTFCYLAPTFESIAESGFNKVAVIVTNGISLQEQLFYKDIPLMKQIFRDIYPDAEFRYCMLKGKQNFLCPQKMSDIIADNYAVKTENKELEKIMDWSYSTFTGDFSELDFVPSFETQSLVACTKQGECTGRKCPKHDECFYMKYKYKCTDTKYQPA